LVDFRASTSENSHPDRSLADIDSRTGGWTIGGGSGAIVGGDATHLQDLDDFYN